VAALQNFKGMMVVRFAIGLVEAVFYPAVLYHMSFWYKPTEIPWRITTFYSVGQLASAFSALLHMQLDPWTDWAISPDGGGSSSSKGFQQSSWFGLLCLDFQITPKQLVPWMPKNELSSCSDYPMQRRPGRRGIGTLDPSKSYSQILQRTHSQYTGLLMA
jgi:hypothetical protein